MTEDNPIIEEGQIVEVAESVSKQSSPYRDERGVRIQKYRRFKEGEDYEALDEKTMVALTKNVLDNIAEYRQERKLGQPRKYESVGEFITVVEQYVQYLQDANIDGIKLIPDVEGLCAFMCISRETLNEWEKSRDASYSDAIKMVKNQLAFCKKQLALSGKIPPIVFATDFNNNHGYVQKQEVSVSVPRNDVETPEALREAAQLLPEVTDG